MKLKARSKGTETRLQEETPTLRRATVGPILAQEFPPAGERPFIGITVAEHFAFDNARFIAVPIHESILGSREFPILCTLWVLSSTASQGVPGFRNESRQRGTRSRKSRYYAEACIWYAAQEIPMIDAEIAKQGIHPQDGESEQSEDKKAIYGWKLF